MSFNQTYGGTQPQFVSCPKCGFMNYANSSWCERCRDGVVGACDAPARRRAWLKSNLLALLDAFFVITMLFGMYFFYFDHYGARTLAQKQFRLTLLLVGSFGCLITGILKFVKKRAG